MYKKVILIVIVAVLGIIPAAQLEEKMNYLKAHEGKTAPAASDGGGTGVTLTYNPTVTVMKYDAEKGKWETIAKDEHNLLVNQGANFIRTQLTESPGANGARWVSLSSNATAPDASYVVLPDEISTNGLSRAAATYAANGTGAWNYTTTWTANTTVNSVQLTGLNYGASGSNLFAALQFTSTNLQANDQLRVIWSISVS